MLMFGAKDPIDQPAGRNLVDYQDNTLPAAAFKLRLNAYAASAMPAYLDSLPPGERAQARGEIEQSNRSLVQMATGMAGFIVPSQIGERASDRKSVARYGVDLGTTGHFKGTH